MKKEKTNFIYAVGRRKRSVCRVRLFKGKGQSLADDLPLDQRFKGFSADYYLKPFEITKNTGKMYVTARVLGGGKNGQVSAFIHALSRALVKENEKENRPILKAAGFLTRDPREKERRKFGNAQKARARKQSPKR